MQNKGSLDDAAARFTQLDVSIESLGLSAEAKVHLSAQLTHRLAVYLHSLIPLGEMLEMDACALFARAHADASTST